MSHKNLLLKLENYGINGNLLKWINSFLSNRRFSVKINNALSSEYPVTRSVPQGSILATIFFILFVNDLSTVVKTSKIKMYADDVTIYHKVNNKRDYNNFQKDLATVQEWAHKWQMNININKCKVLHFGNNNENKTNYLNKVKIVSSKCEKILGVYIDTYCNFKQHIFHIVKKARLAACNILRAFHGCKINILISLFKTYVRSILEHATVVYFPHYTYSILLLENVQRYFTKRLTGL